MDSNHLFNVGFIVEKVELFIVKHSTADPEPDPLHLAVSGSRAGSTQIPAPEPDLDPPEFSVYVYVVENQNCRKKLEFM